jgi:hypothetical protein
VVVVHGEVAFGLEVEVEEAVAGDQRSRNGMPVSTAAWPEPSRLRRREILVSAVSRFREALRD